MLNVIIAFSLRNRLIILAATLAVLLYGSYVAMQLPVDVFPDLNRPTVAIMTEAPGLAPEEVEVLITFPIESMLNGATGVERVRSASGIGLSIVWVEFAWGTDIYVDRQIVAEKLQLARERLPTGTNPVMAPISSIMGEIRLIGLQVAPALAAGDDAPFAGQRAEDGPPGPALTQISHLRSEQTSQMDLRTLADWVVRPRLLAIGGISQVTVMGGELKQYQVLTSPERLTQYNLTLKELTEAVEKSNVVTGGGFLLREASESLIRITGRSVRLGDIEETVVAWRDPTPVLVKHVADVRFGGPVKRGTGSVDAVPAVILSIQKQPGANTLALNALIDSELDSIQTEIQKKYPDVSIQTEICKQADFIRAALDNVKESIRDGALWVIVVLFIFLWNFRVSAITLTAIPLSIMLTAIVFHFWGISINTMTLGGLAIAIGELVDDAIVDIENIYRRLKVNKQKPIPDPPLRVIYYASSEVRNSIVYATLIVLLVVLPLFSMAGLEGRMFVPMGVSYLLTLVMSLVVSLTVVPVLASYLLPGARFIEKPGDPWLLRALKSVDTQVLRFTLRHSYAILLSTSVIVLISVTSILWMGGEFLPPFNEGTFTVNLIASPGTSLDESNRLGTIAERILQEIPEVTRVSRRTGRAELDEHAEGVNYSEIDVGVREPERPKGGIVAAVLRAIPGLRGWGVERVGRDRSAVLADVRDKLTTMPGVVLNVGQPISHRLDHIMSGIRAQIAVKIFGPDLHLLRQKAQEAAELMVPIRGVVDLQVEPQVEISQLRVEVLREEAARYGLAPGDVAAALEIALKGRVVSEVLDQQRTFEMVVWFDEASRHDIDVIQSTLLDTPSGARVTLGQVAQVLDTTGPNTINRENVQRRIVVSCNVADRDLVSVVHEIQQAVAAKLLPTLPEGYFVQYGGQFEAQAQANRRLLVRGIFAVLGVTMLLFKSLGSWRAGLQVMANVPLAAFGSVLFLVLFNWPTRQALHSAHWWQWPKVWVEATSLSVAHWVGFITLIGIVCRNGIMMIAHYIHLMKYEGEKFDENMIIRGSLERLGPVLMTAVTTIIGLVPLLLGAGETGKEILHPLAVVVVGGLLSSTLLDQIVTPALFFKFGRKIYENLQQEEGQDIPRSTTRNRNGYGEPTLPE
jgi:CzcA family heavy metal efflux pump